MKFDFAISGAVSEMSSANKFLVYRGIFGSQVLFELLILVDILQREIVIFFFYESKDVSQVFLANFGSDNALSKDSGLSSC